MNETSTDPDRQETRRTLLVAFGLAAGFLLWGLVLFLVIGERGTPAWDFGAVPDVPGLSVYSTVSRRQTTAGPQYYLHEQAVLSPQHVQERPVIQEPKQKEPTP